MNTKKIHAVSGSARTNRSSTDRNIFEGEDSDPVPTSDDEEPPGTGSCLRSREKSIEHFPIISRRASAFRDRYFPGTGDEEWNDWRWQFRHRIQTLEGLERIFSLSDDEKSSLVFAGGRLPLSLTPYYASLIDPLDIYQPLRKTVIPRLAEFVFSPGESEDPLNEEGHCVAPGLFHRYPDRVLLLATNVCSVNCRYCTRSRIVGTSKRAIGREDWDAALKYISAHREIRDVLVSGGDPLTLSVEKLEYLLSNLRAVPHVEIIRLGTKVPMVLPQRITGPLVRMLKKYHPLWMSIHSTHPDEITPESSEACNRLADAGIPLGSQTVLLKGVNNSTETLMSLFQKLMKIRVRPYYLYQCDPIAGSAHFRTTVREGIELIRSIRGFTSGYAVPHYVIDAPGGGGKIPVSPDYIQGVVDGKLTLKNYEGKIYEYPDNSL
ncbi:MAG: KamA family radical SAM protein [Spirochaetota bacterium]|nr:KamA family radical SAM protein [Spirochaetota bacterium]